ncbi:spore germination protein GerW family protein [Hymenobacter sp. BT491]|uniref:spore germination protein GerW family protein n=1 Tax=Hymenobacter sp. BT491 TaxID=2766779 RepID=UPI001653B0BC|nr:spore germination protein GerW family protein [Hymenobacter sp. BT491]MBC6990521.1 sporulation protein [Hymenobacter sp. BT491]
MSDSTSSLTAPASSIVERLAQQLSTVVSAQTLYGTPVERDGVTVIPVARAQYGFGGGGGTDGSRAGGSGGGAGVNLTPVGYIELKQGNARFRPIRGSVVPLVAVSGLVALLLLRSVPKLLRKR